MGDFNFQFDEPSNTYTSKLLLVLDIIKTLSLSQSITIAAHQHNHILDWVLNCPDDHTLQFISVDYTLASDHVCIVNQLSLPRPVKQLVFVELRNLAAINHGPVCHLSPVLS